MLQWKEQAIERLQLAAIMSKEFYGKDVVLCYSGGKDSDCLVYLALEAGIPFEVINSHTTVDSPITVKYIKDKFKWLEEKGIKATVLIPKYDDGKPKTMWNLIENNGMPPTRLARYCCKELKEVSIPNRLICLGVRKDESTQRKSRKVFEVRGKTKATSKGFDFEHTLNVYNDNKKVSAELGKAVNEENSYDCTLIKACKQTQDVICNPIIDWSDSNVWNYIRENNFKYNPMYDLGYYRVGCVGCPMASYKEKMKQFYDFPNYKTNYIKAFDRMIKKRQEKGLSTTWENGLDCFNWWIDDPDIPGQLSFNFDKGGRDNGET